MQKERLDGAELIYYEKYTAEVKIVKDNHKDMINFITNYWELKKPKNYKIYIMKSHVKYLFCAFPWYWKIILVVTFPFWYFKINEFFELWGSATISKKSFSSILLRPIDIYNNIEKDIGTLLLIKEDDEKKLYKNVIFQEISYICFSSNNLPKWLLKGMVIFSVENYLNVKYFKDESINIFNKSEYKRLVKKNDLSENTKIVILNYVRGYWSVKYLEDNFPGFLKDSIKRDVNINNEISHKMGFNFKKNNFLLKLDNFLYNYYKNRLGV